MERNLLDHQYTFTLNLTLSKEVYDRWSAKFFLISKMLRATAILASLELSRIHIMASKEEVRKEAWGIILRTGQAHFPEGVKEMAETEVQGIQTTNLRLASHTARSLYGTKYIRILGRKDPLKEKVMRRAHLAGPQVLRSVHNLQKTTMANVTFLLPVQEHGGEEDINVEEDHEASPLWAARTPECMRGKRHLGRHHAQGIQCRE